MAKGKIFLIPTPLGDDVLHTIPQYVVDIVHSLDTFIVERAKTARHFIKATNPPYPLSIVQVFELNQENFNLQNTEYQSIRSILEVGKNIGILSEAGCPAIADPGSKVVEWAHQQGYIVEPLVGPSSILLALMASGMNGQSFTFYGYISAKRGELAKDLKKLEETAKRSNQTQIWIEAPYRNKQLIETALITLAPNTKFCIAADLTLPPQYIITKTIAEWRKTVIPDLHKHTAIFLLST
jgi:16S rRNA (cytidine1402-2'-O)-methyltransferase